MVFNAEFGRPIDNGEPLHGIAETHHGVGDRTKELARVMALLTSSELLKAATRK